MTIGMNNLGRNGRLGNQMFQYAALVGIAKQCGYDFRIPDHSNVPHFDYKSGSNERRDKLKQKQENFMDRSKKQKNNPRPKQKFGG